MRATKLQELEVMAAKLMEAARKLPPGQDRHNILQEIGRFRSQIISLQGAGLRPARRELKVRGQNSAARASHLPTFFERDAL
jgi:hypothetical protein